MKIPRLSFIIEALRDRKIGSLTPTSQDAVDAICGHINFETAGMIIECGPGDGAITKEILRRMDHNGSRLLAVEQNAKFARNLLETHGNDQRLNIWHDGAENIARIANEARIKSAQCIISGIPFSRIPRATAIKILRDSAALLGENGSFICYQFRDTVREYLKEVFYIVAADAPTPWNLRHLQPPLLIYEANHPFRSNAHASINDEGIGAEITRNFPVIG